MPQGKGTYGNKVGRPPLRKGVSVVKKNKSDSDNPEVKGVSTKGLTKRQASTLKKHSVHHTAKHIKAMVNAMLNGASFSESHKMAQKSVGK
tara:strand:+ start:1307 stop:1579 length:273 start_codon:yes stop_codon:yes gene_type:complete